MFIPSSFLKFGGIFMFHALISGSNGNVLLLKYATLSTFTAKFG